MLIKILVNIRNLILSYTLHSCFIFDKHLWLFQILVERRNKEQFTHEDRKDEYITRQENTRI